MALNPPVDMMNIVVVGLCVVESWACFQSEEIFLDMFEDEYRQLKVSTSGHLVNSCCLVH